MTLRWFRLILSTVLFEPTWKQVSNINITILHLLFINDTILFCTKSDWATWARACQLAVGSLLDVKIMVFNHTDETCMCFAKLIKFIYCLVVALIEWVFPFQIIKKLNILWTQILYFVTQVYNCTMQLTLFCIQLINCLLKSFKLLI